MGLKPRCTILESASTFPAPFGKTRSSDPLGHWSFHSRGSDIFFYVSALREGDEITQGKAVSFETGPDPKSGKIKAISVDLA
jgi:cold shock CspA family protein